MSFVRGWSMPSSVKPSKDVPFEIEYRGYRVELGLSPSRSGKWTAQIDYFMTDDGRPLFNTGFLSVCDLVGDSAEQVKSAVFQSIVRVVDAGAV